jgi:hypothetical protein
MINRVENGGRSDQFFRIGFAGDRQHLEKGLTRLGELLAEFDRESAAVGAR